MDSGYEAFSDHQHFHATLIEKKIGGLSVYDFLKTYSAQYDKFYAVEPESSWQICQYEGRACIGVFRAYVNPDPVAMSKGDRNFVSFYTHVAFVALDLGRVTDKASAWFRQNRMRGAALTKPVIHVSPHRTVYPINNPNTEED